MSEVIYKLNQVNIPDNELNKNDKFSILIELFIKKDSIKNWTGADYMREKAASKRLLNKYNDFNFFYSLNHLNGKFNSLLGLMSKKYHNLDELYTDYLRAKDKVKKYDLDEPFAHLDC
jgi:hypothetical protein